jgi:tetratricopeptide (TPR) repeat protein
MRPSIIGALVLFAGIAATPASANDMATCTAEQGEPNARLRACERTIATGKWRGKALAPVYGHRGSAYYALGDHDRAIAEYSESIRLDPKQANVLYFRGSSYLAKFDRDRAIADFDQALRKAAL